MTAPTVTSVVPTAGSTAGGPYACGIGGSEQLVKITGTGFVAGSTYVYFGGVGAATQVYVSSTEMLASPPAGTDGTVDITVALVSDTSSADQFTYVTPATVTGVSPDTGSMAGGDTVVITGTGFTETSAVYFRGLSWPAASVTFDSDTQLTVTTPAYGIAQAVDVFVVLDLQATGGNPAYAGVSSVANPPADQFTYE